MMLIKSLNQEIDSHKDNMDIVISELDERQEFVCTADVCGAHACGIFNP